jgi:hypothetical protein
MTGELQTLHQRLPSRNLGVLNDRQLLGRTETLASGSRSKALSDPYATLANVRYQVAQCRSILAGVPAQSHL